MPSIRVDLSSSSVGAAPGQSLPTVGLSSLVIITVAPPKQTLLSIGEATLVSALGVVPAPRPLKWKKLGIKMSAL
jgi:hypothetical protein